jgi:Glycolipid transfer protein (GLTP)
VRSDVGGNIDRLRGRQATDPQKYELVFDIVLAEVAVGSQNGSSSATKGLLWLKRHVNCPACLRSPNSASLAQSHISHPYHALHLPEICGPSHCCQHRITSAVATLPWVRAEAAVVSWAHADIYSTSSDTRSCSPT